MISPVCVAEVHAGHYLSGLQISLSMLPGCTTQPHSISSGVYLRLIEYTESLSIFQGQKVAMTDISSLTGLRKDAQRNRKHILDVARQAFVSEGVNVSMDAIAKKAGVGAGTLYRHFPSKDALLASLLDHHHLVLEQQRLIMEAEESDSGRSLEKWIDALGDWMLAYHGLPEPLQAACQAQSALTPACLNVIDKTETILQAAQNDGLARRDLNGRDIFIAALAVAWASGIKVADQRTRVVLSDMLKKGWGASETQPKS